MKKFSNLKKRGLSKGEKRTTKWGTLFSFFLVILGLSQNVFSQTEANFKLIEPIVSVESGNTFTLNVQVEVVGGQQVDGAEVHLTFDPALLQVTSMTPIEDQLDDLSSFFGFDGFNNTTGIIDYVAGTTSNAPNQTFDILQIEFTAIGANGSDPTLVEFIDPFGVPKTEITFNGLPVLGSSTGATVTIETTVADTAPIISFTDVVNDEVQVDEEGMLTVPVSILDEDGNTLIVTVSSISNEPQKMQSINQFGSGAQRDPFPANADGFLTTGNEVSSAGSYEFDLIFDPIFGDGGGADGDGSGEYTITISVEDEDGITDPVTKELTVIVNDVSQVIAGDGTTRIQAESFDNQGPTNTVTNNTSDSNGIGVEQGGITNIGFTNGGDFVEYEINVLVAGTYKFDFSVAKNSNALATMTINGGNQITVPNNGSWTTYFTVTAPMVELQAGQQTLKLDWTGGAGFNFNVDYFDITPVEAPTLYTITSTAGTGGTITPSGEVAVEEGASQMFTIEPLPDYEIVDVIINGNQSLGAVTDYTFNNVVADGTIQATFQLIDTGGGNIPPGITVSSLVEINAGTNLSESVNISELDNGNANIVIYDKSILNEDNPTPFTPGGVVDASNYSFNGTNGNFTLDWMTTPMDGRSYLGRITANDGTNDPVTKDFTINLAQNILGGAILAKTFINPLPFYGSANGPGAPGEDFSVSIETTNENIGYISNGDFVDYLIFIPNPGVYDLTINAAKGGSGTTQVNVLEGDGTQFNVLGNITVANNGGWQSYNPYSIPNISFPSSGLKVLRFEFLGGVNVLDFVFEFQSGNTTPELVITSPTDGQDITEGDNLTFSATVTDAEENGLESSVLWESDLDGPLNSGNPASSFSTSELSVGRHIITAEVTDTDALDPKTDSETVVVFVLPSCDQTAFRVNAGGPLANLTSSNFEEDQSEVSANGTASLGNKSSYYTGNQDITFGNNTDLVTNTTGYPDEIFKTERYAQGDMTWEFPVSEAGIYNVTILFNENWSGEANDPRTFDVEVEGSVELSSYRPSVAAGGINIAVAETIQTTVEDGVLNINFIQISQNPAVKGFDICFVEPMVSNTPPQVAILGPQDGESIYDCEEDGEFFNLVADASDIEDDASGDDNKVLMVEWFEGETSLGTGEQLNNVSITGIGEHVIKVVATDSDGETAESMVTIQLLAAPVFTAKVADENGADLEGATIVGPEVTIWWNVEGFLVGTSGQHVHLRLDDQDYGLGNSDPQNGLDPYVPRNSAPESFTFPNIAPGEHTLSLIGAETGHNQICEPPVEFTFTVIAPCDVTIGMDPQDATICEGDPVSFNVDALGNGVLSYQWQVDNGSGNGFENIGSSSSTSELAFASMQIGGDGNLYRVIVTSDNGTPDNSDDDCSETSAVATLNVNPNPTPVITGNSTYPFGGDGSLLDAGAGYDSYSWSNGATTQTILALEGSYTVTVTLNDCQGTSPSFDVSEEENTLTLVPNVVGETENEAETLIISAELVVGNTTFENSDSVDEGLVISQNPDSGTSATKGSAVDLVISSGPACVVSIDTQPEDVVVCDGESGSISVVASGSGLISYQWQVSSDGVNFFDFANGGPIGQNAMISFNGLSVNADGNQYRVIVTADNNSTETEDDCQLISEVVTLTVHPTPPLPEFVVTLATCDSPGQVSFPALMEDQEWLVSTDNGQSFNNFSNNTYLLPQGPAPAMSLQFKSVDTVTGCESTIVPQEIDEITCEVEDEMPIADAGDNQMLVDNDGNGSEDVTLNGSASTDDGTIVSYIWKVGGNQVAMGATPNITLPVGTTIVELVVTDDAGQEDMDTVEITINPAPPVDAVLFLVDAGAPGDPKLGIPLVDGLQISKEEIGNMLIGVVYEPEHSLVPTNFVLTGPINQNQSEGPIFPQSLFGDIGIDVNGKVFPVGNYDLVVTPSGQEQIALSFSIVEDQSPDADFSAQQDNGIAYLVNFMDTSSDNDGNIVSWSWDFNEDGIEDASMQNPSYNFGAAGSYEVTLTVTDNDNLTNSITKTVMAFDPNSNQIPLITVLGDNPLEIEQGNPFIDPGASVFDVEDGNSIITGDASAVNTNVIGSYTVFYNFTDSDGGVAIQKTRTVEIVEPTPVDAKLFFVDADLPGDPVLLPLVDGTIVDKGLIGNRNIGIIYVADVQPPTTTFNLTGPINHTKVEGNAVPISLFGDIGVDVLGEVFPVGNNYNLVVNPSNAPAFSVSFQVTDGPPQNLSPIVVANGTADPVTSFKVNFSSDGSFDPDGSIVSYLWNFGGGNTTNAANPSFTFNSAGLKTVSLTVTDDEGASSSTSIQVQAIAPNEAERVVSFVLVDAANGTDIMGLENNSFISSGQNINIRANTNPSIVGSVQFNLSGPVSKQQTESFTPYALFGDVSGVYTAANLPNGEYTLTATPYSAAGASGEVGIPLTISFTVGVLPQTKPIVDTNTMKVSPNPARDNITLSFEKPVEVIEFEVYDVSGRLLRIVKGFSLGKGDGYELETYDLPVGTYYLKAKGSTGQEFSKQMIIKR